MEVTPVETMPLAAVSRATHTPPVFETQFTPRVLTKESDEGLASIMVHMGLTTQVPVDRNLVNFGAEHGADCTEHPAPFSRVVPHRDRREAFRRIETPAV